MEILKHVVMDHFAHRNNWLTNIEVRVKLFYIGIGLLLNILSNDIVIPLVFLVTSLILLKTIKISFLNLGLRMIMPLFFGVFIMLIMGLHKGETVVLSGSFLGYELALKKEGLLIGLLLFTKVAGGVMLLLLLSFTTTISKICMAARWMKIPETITEVLSFVYRYLFLLIEETETMMSSQKSRLGYVTWFKTIKSSRTLTDDVRYWNFPPGMWVQRYRHYPGRRHSTLTPVVRLQSEKILSRKSLGCNQHRLHLWVQQHGQVWLP